jgi:TrwC relaxase
VEWGPADRGRADLVGVPAEVRRAFSRRSAEIVADLSASGRNSWRATEVASVKTREPKDLRLRPDDLRPEWRRRAQQMGFGPLRLEAVLEREGRARDGVTDARALGSSLELETGRTERVLMRLASEGRPIARRNVVRAWGMESGRGAAVDDVERAADSLLETLAPAGTGRGPEGRSLHRPGVAERRFEPDWLALGPLASRSAEMARDRRAAIRRARGLGLDPLRETGRRIAHGIELDRGGTGLDL